MAPLALLMLELTKDKSSKAPWGQKAAAATASAMITAQPVVGV